MAYNKIYESFNVCNYVDDVELCEYGIHIGNGYCTLRCHNNKITEMYFSGFIKNGLYKILSITKDSFNTYNVKDGIFIRNDGEKYITLNNKSLKRVSDGRLYVQKHITIDDIPNIVYVAYYYLYKEPALEIFREGMHDVENLNINKLQKLLLCINTDDCIINVDNIKSNFKLINTQL